jgi:16S rRNA (guanine527-N7)-methyltransferase
MGRRSTTNQAPACPEGFADRWNVSRESQAKLTQFVSELCRWQRTHNLVASSTLDEIWVRHIADGLQLARYILSTDAHILDLGSGGGLPAIPLAIALADRPTNHKITMVESNGKKSAFLAAAARLCKINTRIINARIESLTDSDVERPVSVLTARALASLPDLLEMSASLPVRPQRMLFLKGQHIDVELTAATKCWNISFSKHHSETCVDGCILEIREAERDQSTALPNQHA